ncbi:MAG TPA: hypothetical protein VFQ44_00880 [Streptosporangiaceae bacterium]|nr:hypothetical protein [Streptosporangiaceae bacterium]
MLSSVVRARRVSTAVLAAVLAASAAVGVSAVTAHVRPAFAAAVPAATGPGSHLIARSLGGISCVGKSFCMGVGPFGTQATVDFPDKAFSFSQVWNGKAWLRPVAVPAEGSKSHGLVAVSCATTTSCLAVGDSEVPFTPTQPVQLSDAWNGHTWRELPAPAGSAPSQLTGVACPAASECIAVGDSGPRGQAAVWAQSWDGASWSELTPVDPAGAASSEFSGISCTGAAHCVAVGEYTTGSNIEHALAESWNGTSWTMLPAPPRGLKGLNAIACPAAALCVVVGDAAIRKLAVGSAEWNGSTWTSLTTPNPITVFDNQTLTGVSCASATSCIAVGSGLGAADGFGRGTGPFAERWSGGTGWQLLHVPNPTTVVFGPGGAKTLPNGLAAVSCAGPASCIAVGGDGDTHSLSSFASFAVGWNGSSWQVLRTGTVDGLMGVSCSGLSRCLVAGTYLNPRDLTRTLTESWNGKTMRLADKRGIYGVLSDVSCVSASFCMGAGQGGEVARWNGTRWTVSSPATPDADAEHVSCASASFCMATGTEDGGVTKFWKGGKWHVKTLAAPRGAETIATGVSCTQSTFCVTVGQWFENGRNGPGGALAEVWNGKSWRFIKTPNGSPQSMFTFNSVSCVTRSHCAAIGNEQTTDSSVVHLIAALWNGNHWKVTVLPGTFSFGKWTGGVIGLSDISCATATSCMAVGSQRQAGSEVNLTTSWDGRKWRTTKVPGPGGLSSVSCAAPRQCLAVGLVGIRTLAMAWNGRTWHVIKTKNP